MLKEWIDLSLDINQDTLAYPGDPKAKIAWLKTLNKDGFNVSQLEINMHLGTHIDFKKHVLNEDDDLSLEKFIGKANVIHLQALDGIIQTKDIEDVFDQFIDKEEILLISTGHSVNFGLKKYYSQPRFEKSFFDFLIKNKIKLLGADLPSFEYVNDGFLSMHKDLLSHDIYLVENLSNLSKLSKHVYFIALPLPIKGIEASLIRAIAKNL